MLEKKKLYYIQNGGGSSAIVQEFGRSQVQTQPKHVLVTVMTKKL